MRGFNTSSLLQTALIMLSAYSIMAANVEKAKTTRNATEVVEGSGKGILADLEVNGSGYPTDDEDGDDVHGSGTPPSTDKKDIKKPVIVTERPRPPATTTPVSPIKPVPIKPVATVDRQKEVVVDEDDEDDDEDDEEEEVVTTTKTSVFIATVAPTARPPSTPATRFGAPTTTTESSGPFSPFHETLNNGFMAACLGGGILAVIIAILLFLFVIFRIRKKDEGSYALDEPKPRPYAGYAYTKASTKEFYA